MAADAALSTAASPLDEAFFVVFADALPAGFVADFGAAAFAAGFVLAAFAGVAAFSFPGVALAVTGFAGPAFAGAAFAVAAFAVAAFAVAAFAVAAFGKAFAGFAALSVVFVSSVGRLRVVVVATLTSSFGQP